MEEIKKIYYVYYSFEESGRGYIGYRKCPESFTPETDKYLGSSCDNTFKPIGKTILKGNLTQREAIAVEIYFQRKYKVAEEWNKDFANLSYQTSVGFCYSASGENNPIHGKKCYNNGINNRYFSPNEEIPEGYILGDKEETCNKKSEAQKGEKKANYGKKCYNNGIKNRYFSPDEEIPEGYIMGFKKETKQKQSEAARGKKLSKETKNKISEIKKIRVITSSCCYFSMKNARKELGISGRKFYKLFEKDPLTGFYVEK